MGNVFDHDYRFSLANRLLKPAPVEKPKVSLVSQYQAAPGYPVAKYHVVVLKFREL